MLWDSFSLLRLVDALTSQVTGAALLVYQASVITSTSDLVTLSYSLATIGCDHDTSATGYYYFDDLDTVVFGYGGQGFVK